ncbi:MAG: undecaprenyl/decaprenyl-phosphate alpha-N-acetylglucosaminyl 1-phosphate transferase [Deltaproteobacteria bacterium]|nr:undecaprenyl/decaprenyl-phosphate alpha-N-acetylglucosaminyl 1-phosphate transferase [Deltaproteobacteria bacterium]
MNPGGLGNDLFFGIGIGRIGIVTSAALCSLVLSWLVLAATRRMGKAIEPPRGNPCHTKGVRYGFGGIAVMAAGTLVSVFATGIYSEWRPVLIFAFGLFLIGLLDDSHPLTPGWKVVLQVPLALMIVLWLPRPAWMPYGLPWVLLAAAWLTVMTNAYNILDVVDGLLPSVASIHLAAVGLLLWVQGDTQLAMTALAFAGAAIGFVPRNAWPGRQILGDTGSLPLGGLASLLVMYVDFPTRGAPGWGLAFLLMAVPCFEVCWVTIRRVRQGIAPWRRSPDHFIYWLTERLGSIGFGVAIMAAVQALPFVIVAISLDEKVDMIWPAAILIFLASKPIFTRLTER